MYDLLTMRKMTFAICSVPLLLILAVPSNLDAATIYTTILSGANEVPPVASPGTGNAIVTLNGDILTVDETFSGLTIAASAAHIHCCVPVGVNAVVAVPFVSFPSAVSGTYSRSFDLTMASTYNAPFLTANGGTAASAEAALIAGLNSGLAYANIHNSNFPGGEIRGQLQLVPEPATAGLLLFGLTVVAVARKRRPERA